MQNSIKFTEETPDEFFEEETPDEFFQTCWNMVDNKIMTGSVEQQIQIYKFIEAPVPVPDSIHDFKKNILTIINKGQNKDEKQQPLVVPPPTHHKWRVIQNIQEQIRQQAKNPIPTPMVTRKKKIANLDFQEDIIQISRSIATQTDTIKPIVIRSSSEATRIRKQAAITSKLNRNAKFHKLQKRFASLQAIEAKREANLEETRVKAQEIRLQLLAMKTEIAKLAEKENSIITSYFP